VVWVRVGNFMELEIQFYLGKLRKPKENLRFSKKFSDGVKWFEFVW
jgi:hypothetical protein